ncbi:MAG: hypothetical protein JST40_09520 [Armatimonadetes bacterium]|nr:hypothetical protein [Armatimonadota bacterium]
MIGTRDFRVECQRNAAIAFGIWLVLAAFGAFAAERGGAQALFPTGLAPETCIQIVWTLPYLATIALGAMFGYMATGKGYSWAYGLLAAAFPFIGWWALGFALLIVGLPDRFEVYEDAPIFVGGNPFGYRDHGPVFVQPSTVTKNASPTHHLEW